MSNYLSIRNKVIKSMKELIRKHAISVIMRSLEDEEDIDIDNINIDINVDTIYNIELEHMIINTQKSWQNGTTARIYSIIYKVTDKDGRPIITKESNIHFIFRKTMYEHGYSNVYINCHQRNIYNPENIDHKEVE